MIQDSYIDTFLRQRAVRTSDNKGGYSIVWGNNINNITLGATTSIRCDGHSYSSGNLIYFEGIVGTTQLNGNTYEITVIDANNFTINVNSTSYGAYVSGGLTYLSFSGSRQSRTGMENISDDKVTSFHKEVVYTNCADLYVGDKLKNGSEILEIENIDIKRNMFGTNHYEINVTRIT